MCSACAKCMHTLETQTDRWLVHLRVLSSTCKSKGLNIRNQGWYNVPLPFYCQHKQILVRKNNQIVSRTRAISYRLNAYHIYNDHIVMTIMGQSGAVNNECTYFNVKKNLFLFQIMRYRCRKTHPISN